MERISEADLQPTYCLSCTVEAEVCYEENEQALMRMRIKDTVDKHHLCLKLRIYFYVTKHTHENHLEQLYTNSLFNSKQEISLIALLLCC